MPDLDKLIKSHAITYDGLFHRVTIKMNPKDKVTVGLIAYICKKFDIPDTASIYIEDGFLFLSKQLTFTHTELRRPVGKGI